MLGIVYQFTAEDEQKPELTYAPYPQSKKMIFFFQIDFCDDGHYTKGGGDCYKMILICLENLNFLKPKICNYSSPGGFSLMINLHILNLV